jgi:hypothetical protein
VLRLPGRNRTPDGYPAGGAALHFAPNSQRFSNELDFFHDSEERVASAFAADADLLRKAGSTVEVELSQPGHIRSLGSRGEDSSRKSRSLVVHGPAPALRAGGRDGSLIRRA